MTSLKNCAGDVFLIIYFFIYTFAENAHCDDNFNKNYKETFLPKVFNQRSIDGFTSNQESNNRNVKKNQIDFKYLTSSDQQSEINNYTSTTIDQRNNVTKLPSKLTSIVECYACIDSENHDSEQDVENNKLFKLNYTQNAVNETIYLNGNFENLTDRQRRDVIDESSTSSNGLHGK